MNWTTLLAAVVAAGCSAPVAATCEDGARSGWNDDPWGQVYYEHCADPNAGQECVSVNTGSMIAATCLDQLLVSATVIFDIGEGGPCTAPITVTTRRGTSYDIEIDPHGAREGGSGECIDLWHCENDTRVNGSQICQEDQYVHVRDDAIGMDPWDDCPEALQGGADGDPCEGELQCIGRRNLPEGSWGPSSDTIFVYCDDGILRLFPMENAIARNL